MLTSIQMLFFLLKIAIKFHFCAPRFVKSHNWQYTKILLLQQLQADVEFLQRLLLLSHRDEIFTPVLGLILFAMHLLPRVLQL